VNDRREPYDLAAAGADYPARSGPPDRTVVVCSHPRSGSTLLGEAIYAAGGLGCPLEYLHRGFRPAFAQRWDAHDLPAYTQAMHRHRTDPSGVFSIKLFWQDVEETVAEGRDPGADLNGVLDCLRPILPDATFVYLARVDRVRQAVSAFIATETSSFRSLPAQPHSNAVAGTQAPPERTAVYDYDAILRQLAAADYSKARWNALFAATGIEPYRVEYEHLVADYRGTTAGVLARLGSPAEPAPPRLQRQATAQSEEFVLRFLTDDERRDHAIATLPGDDRRLRRGRTHRART
jgi:trehalose 2-sulfotransferase